MQSEKLIAEIASAIDILEEAFKNNKKVLFCGNGGSAADSEHLAAELSGRFKLNRKPLNADALHNSGSALTAISNDYSYDQVYARLVEAKGQKGDVLIAISTSGSSQNVINAIATAHSLSMKIITISGQSNPRYHDKSDIKIVIPSTDTARIQESYMLIGHIICEQVEKNLFA